MDKYTLITGGTEGIGLELAKLFAKDNHNLLIVARNEVKLQEVKKQIEDIYKVKVEIVSIDLGVDKSCEKLFEFVDEKNVIVDNLINNAGIGSFREFYKAEEGFEDKIININIVALTKITKYYFKEMVKQGEGRIMNVASTAAFVGGPKMALYYSTKAYVLSLTEALYEEGKKYGIKVSCLCPGPVKTKFQEKSGIKKSESAKKFLMDPYEVARIAYDDFNKGKCIIIPGIRNKVLVIANKFAPRTITRKIVSLTNK